MAQSTATVTQMTWRNVFEIRAEENGGQQKTFHLITIEILGLKSAIDPLRRTFIAP